jgi:hypothetical protein
LITVTTKRTYYDATHYGTDEKGVLRVYRSDELLGEHELGAGITVTEEPPLFSGAPISFNMLCGS